MQFQANTLVLVCLEFLSQQIVGNNAVIKSQKHSSSIMWMESQYSATTPYGLHMFKYCFREMKPVKKSPCCVSCPSHNILVPKFSPDNDSHWRGLGWTSELRYSQFAAGNSKASSISFNSIKSIGIPMEVATLLLL